MLNKKKTEKTQINNVFPAGAHENYMGGPSYDLSPFATLYVMATSSFFGENGYYGDVKRNRESRETKDFVSMLEACFGTLGAHIRSLMSGKNRAEAMREAIEKSLTYDPELTLRFLAWLRQDAFMRATPAVGLAIASRSEKLRGSGMLRSVSNDILSRLDDVTNCLAYYLNEFGKPIPNSLKKVIAARLSSAKEYELAKYTGKNRSVTLKDAIRLTHAHSAAIDKFCRGEISLANEGLEAWESIISKEGASKESWEKAIPHMGHMALLRNLRNFEKHGVDEALYAGKLVAGAETGKQLPFRYYSAWVNVKSASLKQALEKCLDISIRNLPVLPGRSLILSDNSGSATSTYVSALSYIRVSTCGNLMGVLTGLVSESGKLGLFGDKIKYLPINKNFNGTALEMLATANDIGDRVGGATENGIWLALRDAIQSKEHFDRIFIYSDMQAGHGGLYGLDEEKYPVFDKDSYAAKYIDVPLLVQEYRKTVNPDCKLYSVQIGGYGDNILPEFYPDTCILGGWSPELLRFAAMFEQGVASIEEQFRKKFRLS